MMPTSFLVSDLVRAEAKWLLDQASLANVTRAKLEAAFGGVANGDNDVIDLRELQLLSQASREGRGSDGKVLVS